MEKEWVGFMTRRLPKARRRAFTLVEVLLALALATIVLSALQSLIMIAGRAIPDLDGVQASTVAASDALERLTGEVSVAVEVLEVSATSITFSVNDWTGDDVLETIKYAWSGVAGDPLLRAVNGGNATVLIDSVESFSLAADTRQEDVFVGGNEQQLDGQLVQSIAVTTSGTARYVTPTAAFAQRIIPNLPADTSSWKVRDVKIWAHTWKLSTGLLIIELRGFDTASGTPTDQVYGTRTVDTSLVGGSGVAVTVDMNSSQMSPSQAVCFVVRTENSNVDSDLVFGLSTSGLGGRTAYVSGDGGASWTLSALNAIQNDITADIWVGSSGKETRTALVGLETMLQHGSPLTTVTRSVRPFNTPKVLP